MFCTLWQTYTHKLPQAHTHRLVHYRANSKVQICKLILKSLSDLRLADTVLSESVLRFRPTMCTITALQLHKTSNFPNPSLPWVYLITRLSLSFKVWPHIHSSQVDCPVMYCLQMCSNMISTITDIFFFSIYRVSIFSPLHTACTHGSCTHSHSCLYM